MHSNRNFFILLISIGMLLVVLEVIGVVYYLYWQTFWYDIPMHLLAGLFVSLSIFPFALYVMDTRPPFSRKSLLLWVFCLTLFIGVSWEIFELAEKLTSLSDKIYFFDTGKDLVDDILGSLSGLYIIGRFYLPPVV